MFEGSGRLKDEASVWIFGFKQDASEEQGASMLNAARGFLQSWRAHGVALSAAAELRYDRFLIVGAEDPSGCSIDKLYRFVDEAARAVGLSLEQESAIFYRSAGGAICSASRKEFENIARSAAVSKETIVFNNGVRCVGELDGGAWELPYERSWHATYFG